MLVITKHRHYLKQDDLKNILLDIGKEVSPNLEVDLREAFPDFNGESVDGYRIHLRVKDKCGEFHTRGSGFLKTPTACKHAHAKFLRKLNRLNERGIEAVLVGRERGKSVEWYPPETAIYMMSNDRPCDCKPEPDEPQLPKWW